MKRKMVVAIYIRVSTQEQALEGYSIDEQQKRLLSFCEAKNWTVYKIYVDSGYSGSNLDRPAVQQLIKDAERHCFDMVLIYKLDRLSRSQKDTMHLLEDVFLVNNVDLVAMNESFDTSTPFGRAMIGILSVFAQLERENIKERTSMGRKARISKGYFHGSHPPLGYQFKPGGNDLEINQYESVIVREIFDKFLSGATIYSIAEDMEKTYGNNVRGWNNTMIRRILRNPVYFGKVRYGGETFDGLHEPLISEKDFAKVQAVLTRNKELDRRTYDYRTSTGKTADHLLTGLLYCGDCGARMAYNKVSKNVSRYSCYSVSRKNKVLIRSDYCTNRLNPYSAHELEELILGEIAKLAKDPDHVVETIETTSPDDKSTPIRNRLDEVNTQVSKLLDLYQLGFTDLSQISEKLEALKDEKNKLENQLENLKVIPTIDVNAVYETLEDFDDLLEYGTPQEIHAVVHTLIDKIVILNDDIKIYWSFC